MTEQHTYCAAPNCTRRGEHLSTCTTDTCTGCWLRTADHGHLCQRHYDRVTKALQIADKLIEALAGVERAIRTDSSSSTLAGPRLPLTAWQLDLDGIERARSSYAGDLDAWISDYDQTLDALEFARLVHAAEQRHPVQDRPIGMPRVRCGRCRQLTVINRPPDWYTDSRTLKCSDPECGWSTRDEDHLEAAAYVEAQVRDPYSRIRPPQNDTQLVDQAQITALMDALQ